ADGPEDEDAGGIHALLGRQSSELRDFRSQPPPLPPGFECRRPLGAGGAPACAGAADPAPRCRSSTLAPSLSLSAPSTTTISPGFRPAVMAMLVASPGPKVTFRTLTV